MSNVKVNGNTYNGVESIKLMKADGSGYAEYRENEDSAADFRDTLVKGSSSIGDYTNEAGSGYIGWLSMLGGGTISFPYMTTAQGGISNAKFDNLLFPNLSTVNSKQAATGSYPAISSFNALKVSGVLDLSKLTTIQNAANGAGFANSEIGTLKLGDFFNVHVNFIQNATITNFVWNITKGPNATYLNLAKAITNLYVPNAVLESYQTAVSDGTLTKITNVYSIDDWED